MRRRKRTQETDSGSERVQTQERKIVCLEEHAREGEKSRVTQREGDVQEREDVPKSEGTQEIYGKWGWGGVRGAKHIQERGNAYSRERA